MLGVRDEGAREARQAEGVGGGAGAAARGDAARAGGAGARAGGAPARAARRARRLGARHRPLARRPAPPLARGQQQGVSHLHSSTPSLSLTLLHCLALTHDVFLLTVTIQLALSLNFGGPDSTS